MNKYFKRSTALLAAAVMTFCTAGSSVFFADAYEDGKEITVVFDLGENAEPTGKTDVSLFEPFTTTDRYFSIPKGSFDCGDLTLSGWTVTGFEGLFGGDTYIMSDDFDGDTLVVKPVWYDPLSDERYNITYHLEFDGEEIELPKGLKNTTAIPGTIFTPEYILINTDKATTRELYVEGVEMGFGRRFVMPDHDVTITRGWHRITTWKFVPGDVDRINGSTLQTFEKVEGASTELPASDRFSRSGFNLTGWLSSLDGEVYAPLQTVTVPDEDVTFTAVWEPKNYNVVFIPGNGGDTIKVPGLTDTTIECPEPGVTVSGKYFAGWQDSKGEIHQPGDQYLILGAIPGQGISLKGVWKDGEAPQQPTVGELPEGYIYGDANDDNKITIADATSILQSIVNPAKYGLSERGERCADCCNPGDGVTPMDALAVQKFDAGEIKSLPEFTK